MTTDEAIAELRHLHGKTRLTRALSVPQPVVDAILAGALDGSLVASLGVAKLVADAVAAEREAAGLLRGHAAAAAILLRNFGISESVAEFLEKAVAEFDEAAAIRRAAEGEKA